MSQGVTALIPAVHEPGIRATIVSALEQGVDQVIVAINNTDDPATRLAAKSVDDSQVRVIDLGPVEGRKAGALNRALPFVNTDLVLVMDADTTLISGWLDAALAELNDAAVGAVGAVFTADSDRGWLRACQAREWGRYAEEIDRVGKTFVLSGTAALIRMEALQQVNGYNESSITEDFRLTVDLLGAGWKLRSPIECGSVTETMPTVKDLFKQRRRWSLGALQTIFRVGWHEHTRIYWGQQAMLAAAILCMTTFLTLTAVVISLGWFELTWISLIIAGIFSMERVVTVWDMSWRHRIVAATLFLRLRTH